MCETVDKIEQELDVLYEQLQYVEDEIFLTIRKLREAKAHADK